MKNKMKSLASRSLSAVMAVTLLSACGNTPAPSAAQSANASEPAPAKTLSVMAGFYPMYDFASKIGGDKVVVTDMVPVGTEPHDWEPAASDLTNLEQDR